MEKPTSLSAEKRALLELRLKGASRKPPTGIRRLVRREQGGPAPLSFAQFYIWASDRAMPGNPAYNLPYGFRIRGALNVEALERSLNTIVRRHEILRTSFSVSNGAPTQVVLPDGRISLAIVNIADLTPGERETRLRELTSEESVAPFDLSRGPLIRATLYVLDAAEHVLVITLHHIAADGLSLDPLLRELDLLYAAEVAGSSGDLPEVPIQYADYAEWIRREVASGAYDAQAEYWRGRLAGRFTPMALPYDRPRPAARSFRGGNVYFSIPSALVARLNALNTGPGASFFSAALAAFQVLLHRCSGAEDFLVLTPVSVRNQDELRPLVGDFLNLVPLRCDVSGLPTFAQVLERSRESTLDALSNKDLPFDRIADNITMDRESGRDPVFQSLLQVLPATATTLGGLNVEPYDIDYKFSQFDLSLHLYERPEGYRGRFEYSTDVFAHETVERLAANFLHLLEDAAAHPERPVGALAWPHAMERRSFAPATVQSAPHVAPQGMLEQQIAAVWRELLRVEQVGVNDNFFDLGGHSLLLVKTCERLSAELGRELAVVDLFTYPTVAALARYIGGGSPASSTLSAEATARARHRSRDGAPEPIAIIGMAGRFPGARDIESFWANLRAGRESIRFFSADELREAGVPDEVLDDPGYVRAYGYLEDVDQFDASLFGYSSREAEILDPQERLLLQVAHETLERAGYDPDRYPGLIGVYAGSQMNRYLSNARPQHVPLGAAGWESTALASHSDFLTTRISYKLNLRGPSVNVQTACSTSLVAVHQACRALQGGDCDMALAGGVAIMLPQKCGVMFVEGGIFSSDGHCRSFDANATGTVGGNGVGLVLLKRLSDALADGDHIHAVIRGTAINNDGAAKAGYTAPSVEGEAQVIALAQAAANCEPDSIEYVEAHGSATALGDPIEVTALRRVFGDGRQRRSPCYIGSVKTNVGHLFAAAGVTGLIKTALSIEHGELVPSLNFKNPNPQIDFANGPFRVCSELRPWPRAADAPRRAGVSSFGFGGTNAHVVLEEAPVPAPSDPAHGWQLLCLSARSETALAQAVGNLARHLREHPEVNLADAAYTLQVGRREYSHRAVVACRDVQDAVEVLGAPASPRILRGTHKGGHRAVNFMFTGQGAQYPNMGLGLYRSRPVFRDAVDRCFEALRPSLGFDLRDVLFPQPDAVAEAAERLQRTEVTQPALFTIEYALAMLWMSLGVQPAALIGHSIGEYVAACVAGVMSLEDALDLVAERGRLMGQLPAGSMLAVPMTEAEVVPLLGERLSLAAVNSPMMCVVSGPSADVDALEAHLVSLGHSPRRLRTSHAFHSSMMDPILDAFAARVGRVSLRPPSIPYVSNVTGNWITSGEATDPAYYAAHLRQAVRFADGLERLFADSTSVFLEVGPGNTLVSLAKRHPGHGADQVFIATTRRPDEEQRDDQAAFLEAMGSLWTAGVRPDWAAWHAGTRRRRVQLPTYPFQGQRYWLAPAANRGSTPATLARTADIDAWTYVPSWRRVAAPESDADRRKANWLVFVDPQGLGTQLADRLAAGGARVVRVEIGDRFAVLGSGRYAVNPAARGDYDQLLSELKHESWTPRFIAHLWSVRGNDEVREGGEFANECRARGFDSLVALAQALEDSGTTGSLGLAVLTSHTCDVSGSERLCPDNALVLGPCKVIGMEYPRIHTRLIDVSPGEDQSWLARALASDLCAPWTEPTVAYRGRYRWAQGFERTRLPEPAAGVVRDGSVVLIAGGLGLMGLSIAERLSRVARVKLVLMGRTGLPPRAEWDGWRARHDANDATSQAISRVLQIEANGAEVHVVQGDVADEDRLRAIVSDIESRLGPLRGVIHAAGPTPVANPIQALSPADCEAQFRPRLDGLRALHRVLQGKPLDFFLVNTSLASVMGVMDYVAYSAAQAFMDVFVHAHNRRTNGVMWKAINWDNWVAADAEAGSASSAMTRFFVKPAEAADLLLRFLAMQDLPQVLVSTGDLQGRIDQVIRREAVVSADESAQAGTAPASTGHPRPALSTPYVAPRDDVERLLAGIWGATLGVDQVGIHDNFFDLGGDSIISIQITAKANQAGLKFTPRQAFEHQTIAALAEVVRARTAAPRPDKEEARPAAAGGKAQGGRGVSAADLAEIRRQLAARGKKSS